MIQRTARFGYGLRCKQQVNCLALFHRILRRSSQPYRDGLWTILYPTDILASPSSPDQGFHWAFYSAPVIYIYLDRGEQMHESMRSSVETGVYMHMCERSRCRKFNLFRRNVIYSYSNRLFSRAPRNRPTSDPDQRGPQNIATNENSIGTVKAPLCRSLVSSKSKDVQADSLLHSAARGSFQ